MNRPSREVWLFRVELPAGIEHGGRFMARVLKHLLRAWGVKATAILDAPAETSAIGAAVEKAASIGCATFTGPTKANEGL